MAGVQKTYALVLGLVLALVGVLGFFTDMILGTFGVNAWQSLLHVIAAGFGIYAGTQQDGKGYNQTIGWIGVALGVLGYVPGIMDLLANWFNINEAISLLHLAIGVVSLGVYYGVKE